MIRKLIRKVLRQGDATAAPPAMTPSTWSQDPPMPGPNRIRKLIRKVLGRSDATAAPPAMTPYVWSQDSLTPGPTRIRKLIRKVLGRSDATAAPPAMTPSTWSQDPPTPVSKYPTIATIQEVKGFRDLPIAKGGAGVLLLDDFEHGNLDLYVREEVHANAKSELLDGIGLKGKGMKVYYQLDLDQEHRSVDIARKFIMKEGVQDWSAYKDINLVIKVEKATALLRLCIIEEDGDWWNFVNYEVLEPGKWYWVKIPLEKMFPLENFSIKGDGKQDFSKVAELRFLFDSTDIGVNLPENTAYLDQVFLSR